MFNNKIIKLKQARSKLISSSKIHIDELIFEIYLPIINEQRNRFRDICIVTEDKNFIHQLTGENIEVLSFDKLISKSEGSMDLILIFSQLNFRDKIEDDLKRIKIILKEKGLLLCSFFSENNLIDFKNLMHTIEISHFDGVSQRFHPIVDIRDIGNLFNQLGYINTVIQKEKFSYQYDSLKLFLTHMRKMVFTNSLIVHSNHQINKNFYKDLEKKFIQIMNGIVNFELLISCSWKDD